MTVRALSSRQWAVPSNAASDGAVSNELSMLRAHYVHCNGCKGRWFSVRCAIDALDGFVATRFVTTLAVVAAVVGVGSLVL